MVEIYDGYGQVREDFTSAEIASFTDDKVVGLDARIVSLKNLRDALSAETSAELALETAIAADDEIKLQKQKFFPPLTPHQNWLRDVKRVKPSQSVTGAVATTDDAEPGVRVLSEGDDAALPGELTLAQWDERISATEQAVDDARALLRSCRDGVRRAREEVEKTTKAFLAEFPPVTFRQNLDREYGKDRDRKLALVKQGLPADYKPPGPTPPSMIDISAQYSHGGDANRRGGSAFRRGAHPRSQFGQRVKLPSDR